MNQKFKTDKDFECLNITRNSAELSSLEKELLSKGELVIPLVTWNGVIVDGYDNYKLLLKNPQFICKAFNMNFSTKEEAIAWLCKKQMHTKVLSERYRRYLLGKQYEANKRIEKFHGNQYTHFGRVNPQNKTNQHKTRALIAERNGVSESEVKYSYAFCKGLDAAENISPGIRREILLAEIKPTYQSVISIAKLPFKKRKQAVAELHFNTDKRKKNNYENN